MKIKLENISRVFQEIKAVDNLNIEIKDGSLLSILGPSGCGKSTTLSLISGLDHPTDGDIYFDNVNVSDVLAEDRNIGMVFQDYALYPHMSAQDNIAFPLKMKGMKKRDRLIEVQKISKLLHINDLLKRKPGKLSGGQQQRVAIARALVKEPDLLLLDEPLSNLDARLRIKLRDDIKSLQKKLNITTIFVTHDQEEAMSISDKILLLNKGKLVQYGSPMDLYLAPNNIFTGKFLGNPPMNLAKANKIHNEIFFDDSDIKLNSDNYKINCPDIKLFKSDEKANLTIGIRPEDLYIDSNGPIKSNIKSIQTLGKEAYIKFDLGNESWICSSNWNRELKVGDTISFQAKLIHIFFENLDKYNEINGA
ncbi:MAG: ABC transporter ATP-binding protein [Peptostreptococcus sp.]|uniref:ABC transporter ATP-binding protein n=1 Tax=Peptostreptococcus sp. TaxID=1262 RepID=UPI002FC965B6